MARRLSLRWRLAALSLGASALVFAAALFLASALARRVAERELGERLAGVAAAAASTLPADLLVLLAPGDESSRTYGHVRERLLALRKATGAARVLVVDPARRLLCTSEDGGRVGDPVPALERDRLELAEVLRGRPQASSVLFEGVDHQLYKSGYAPVADDAGKVVAVVAVDGSASFFAPLQSLRLELLLLGLAGALALALTSVGIGSAFARPIFALVRAARAIGSGDLETPVSLRRGDELGVLADNLEQMRTALLARDRHLQMMLAGVAHEVRNPLGGMELYAGLLADDLHDRPEQLQLLAKIRRELDYLKALVDDFLDFARSKPLQEEPLDLGQLVDEVAELAGPFAAPRRVRLEVARPPGEAPVRGEARGLRRALLNLLKNACEASPEGSVVRLELARAGADWAATVRDEGPGVPADKRESIFEPFFTTKEKGTGLGLAFARKLAEAHRGRLELLPSERGAHFRLTLPGGPA